MMKLMTLTFAVTIFLNVSLFAQDTVSVVETDSLYQNKILFLPALGSTPETGFRFGAVVVPQFKLPGTGAHTRPSSLLFSGIYTTKKQILLGLLSDVMLPGASWFYCFCCNL
ncbi:MAG: hypothetical protein ACQETF_11195 [Bacteroidota bacterium]